MHSSRRGPLRQCSWYSLNAARTGVPLPVPPRPLRPLATAPVGLRGELFTLTLAAPSVAATPAGNESLLKPRLALVAYRPLLLLASAWAPASGACHSTSNTTAVTPDPRRLPRCSVCKNASGLCTCVELP